MKIDFLKQRAEDFLETAEYHKRGGKWHLAAFDLEQACQLYLKYALFLKLRQFPAIHGLGELLGAVGKAYKKERIIKNLLRRNINIISDLNQAYITSRYLPAEFSADQIKNMERFSKELITLLKSLWQKH